MKVENIKKLPTEFDFVSRVNPFGILYHAKEQCHRDVSCEPEIIREEDKEI